MNKIEPIIQTKKLKKHFMGVRAIDDLSVDIPAGIATGLIGPNGSGKTTLMNLLTGMLTPDDGEMNIAGKSYRLIQPTGLRTLKIARTFQDSRLISQLSVVDNLLLAISENRLVPALFDTRTEQKKVKHILEKIGLTHAGNKKAGELSYGQQKLLEMGRSLIQEADIYFFDEPFTGLFPEIVEQILGLLQELKQQGKTLVVIEHNMGLIKRLCDYTIVLDQGKLLAEGTPAEVLQKKSVQEAYLGK